MSTSALWDKQAHRWSGVTPAGRLPECGVLPCCDSILSVPESAPAPSHTRAFLKPASHIAHGSLSWRMASTPAACREVATCRIRVVCAEGGFSAELFKCSVMFWLQKNTERKGQKNSNVINTWNIYKAEFRVRTLSLGYFRLGESCPSHICLTNMKPVPAARLHSSA